MLVPVFIQVSWTTDKENYLWEIVAKSRGSEAGAPDCECSCSLLTLALVANIRGKGRRLPPDSMYPFRIYSTGHRYDTSRTYADFKLSRVR